MQDLTLYGAGWCPNTLQAKAFLQKNNIPFEYVNVEVSQEATAQIAEYLGSKPVVPTLVWEGKTYPNPGEALLASLLGINPQHRVMLYGADWCPDCHRAKAFLRENSVHFQYVDMDATPGAAEEVTRLNNGKRIIPTVLINGEAYGNPQQHGAPPGAWLAGTPKPARVRRGHHRRRGCRVNYRHLRPA